MDDIARDLCTALRMFRRQPAFALSVVATLALGVAAATAIFTLVNALLLQGLPFPESGRLMSVHERDAQRASQSGNSSYPDLVDYRAQNSSFVVLAGYSGGTRTIVDAAGVADRVAMTEVTDGFFTMLGVRPFLGREFIPSDYDPNAPPVVMLSHGAWRMRFGGDAAIVGREISLGAQRAQVVGVLPASFFVPSRGQTELWLPIRPTQAQRERRYFHWLDLIGRLKPGVTVDAARADLDVIAARFATDDPRYHPATRVDVMSWEERSIRAVRPLLVALAMGALVLLAIAGANIAGLFVARAATRSRELAVRAALGAGGSRLARQLLAEGLALGLPAAIVGLAAGDLAVRLLVDAVPGTQRSTLPQFETLGLSAPTIAFALVASAVIAAIAALAPLWQATRQAATAGLRARSGPRAHDRRLQAVLVVAQVALALVLLAGAGLMARSVARLMSVSPGFDTNSLVTLRVNPGDAKYNAPDIARAFHDDVLGRVGALPGTAGAATVSQLPLSGRGNTGAFTVQSEPGSADVTTLIRTVNPTYFATAGVPLRAGRAFTETDTSAAARVVVVNEAAARTFFGGRAIGERISFPFFDGQPWWEIVGVVGDEQYVSLDAEMAPVVYFPSAQTPSATFFLVVRSDGDSGDVGRRARAAIADLDPAVPVFQVQTMEEIVRASDAVYRRRLAMLLLAVFSMSAVLLAAVGVYGLLAQVVVDRTHELGIRAALGATQHQLAATIARHGLRLAVIGLAAGLLVSLFTGRALQTLLFGVGVVDPLSLGLSAALLGVVAVAACLVPALRALRADPAEVFRTD
jgi:predicted permease